MRIGNLLLVILTALGVSAQPLDESKNYAAAVVGFYNLENLFDTLIDPDPNKRLQDEFTPHGKNQWNTAKYYEKLGNVARVISEMGVEINPDGPAILGVAEIENNLPLLDLAKMDKLKSRNYQVVHHEGPDRRGVDVALLYNPTYFKLESSKSITLKLPNDSSFATRDQLLVTGKLNGERMHFMVAHWPSRRGGQRKSDYKRVAAGELGRSVIDSILKQEPNAKIIYLGDLNDDPNNNSIKKSMLATGKKADVAGCSSGAEKCPLFNPMWDLFQKGIGTLAWRDNWNLFDQIILSPALCTDGYDSYKYYGAKVFNPGFVKQSEGHFKGYPHRTYAGGSYLGGFSDHFGVYVFLIKESSL